MQTVAQVKEEIYNRMLMIAEPVAKYVPGSSKQVDALLAELRQITDKRAKGETIPLGSRKRFSEIVTELNQNPSPEGIILSTRELASIIKMSRGALAAYIIPKQKEIDERFIKKREGREVLLQELRTIVSMKRSGRIQPQYRDRFSEIIARLNQVHDMTLSELEIITGIGRDYLSDYRKRFIDDDKPKLPFTKGPNPAKKMWWKQSGKSYKEIWSFAQYITGISPIKSRADYEKIAIEAVEYLNIDDADKKQLSVKGQLLKYISSTQGGAMELQSMSAYRSAVELPIMFIQWLSEIKNKELTFSDLSLRIEAGLVSKISNPNGITVETLDDFSKDWVPERFQDKPGGLKTRSIFSIIHIFDYAPKFHKYLAKKEVIVYPFTDLNYPTKPEKSEDEDVGPVYNINELDEIFNKIIPVKDQGIKLFMRLLLQSGSRPEQIVSIKCKDIINTPTTTDIYGKTFYIINTRVILEEGKAERGEGVRQKFSTGKSYISEGLMNDFKAWMIQRQLKPEDPIFLPNAEGRGFMTLNGMRNRVRYGAHILTGYKKAKIITPAGEEKQVWVRDVSKPILLSHAEPEFYKPYGMRKTFASILYALTGEQGYVIRRGGWETGSTVPWTYYTRLMKAPDALAVFKKYEIYIDPDATTSSGKPFSEHIKEIDEEVAPPKVDKIVDDKMKALEEQNLTQKQEMAELRKMMEDLAKQIQKK